jgi:glycosyltransferase involved in cell wall biosynthesis
MEAPLVTVVIVFRNEAAFLTEAIESVLGQSFDTWELVLVDDGSDDGSSNVAREYAIARPARIRYLEHDGHAHRGISASRNVGLAHARAARVAFLDADDVWHPNALRDQVALLDAEPRAALVYGPIEYWFSWTGDELDRQRDYVEPLGVPTDRLLPPPGPLARFLRDRAAVPSGLLLRHEAALAVGGFEEAFTGDYDDQVFLAKVCLQFPVLTASRCWYRYRRHPGSTYEVGLRTGATHTARLAFLTWLSGYIAGGARRWPDVWWACQVERWRFTQPRVFSLVRRFERLTGALGRQGRT